MPCVLCEYVLCKYVKYTVRPAFDRYISFGSACLPLLRQLVGYHRDIRSVMAFGRAKDIIMEKDESLSVTEAATEGQPVSIEGSTEYFIDRAVEKALGEFFRSRRT